MLITRPAEDAKKLQSSLLELGINSLIEPLLQFTSLDLSNLFVELNSNHKIIVTSKNAIKSIALQTEKRNFEIICMTDLIAKYAENSNFLNVQSANVANAKEFIEYLSDHLSKDRKIVYFSGENITTDISQILQSDFKKITRINCYKMLAKEILSSQCVNYIEKGNITSTAIFSSRTADVFNKLIAKHQLEKYVEKIIFFVLSKNIAEKLLYYRKINIIKCEDEIIRYFSV